MNCGPSVSRMCESCTLNLHVNDAPRLWKKRCPYVHSGQSGESDGAPDMSDSSSVTSVFESLRSPR